MQEKLLGWFDDNRRVMPWRAPRGRRPDPYHVWLSEVMLQQTTVATVGPYFQKFIGKWPRLADLAAASRDDVMTAWAGLGYYARARNLHACAQKVMTEYGGTFPATEEGLLDLPGIGPYTAAAVAAIAFDRPTVAVDGNVERVVSRLYRVQDPMPGAKVEIRARARDLALGNVRPGDFVQALMELGSIVCTPVRPKCGQCPWQEYCEAFRKGDAETFPRATAKSARPTRKGVVFWLEDAKGRVFMRRRPDKGLLGGMMEFPSTEWIEKRAPLAATVSRQAPVAGVKWQPVGQGAVRHAFSHFNLELVVWRGRIARIAGIRGGFWVKSGEVSAQALPSVMQKVAKLVQSARRG